MAVLVENRKARFDYEIVEKFQAGVELRGFEVKAIKGGRGNLAGAYIGVRGGEAFLLGGDIPPHQPANAPEGYDSRRARKLLLAKKEIEQLAEAEQTKGLTIVPLSLYTHHRLVKLELGIGRGKKRFDKRQKIKKRETDIEIRRTLKKSSSW